MLLPAGIGYDPPILPKLDKTLIPVLAASIMCLFLPEKRAVVRKKRPSKLRANRAAKETDFSRIRRESVGRRSAPEIAVGGRADRFSNSWLEKILITALFATPFISYLNNTRPYIVGPRVIQGLTMYDAFSMALSILIALLPYLLGRRYLSGSDQHVILIRGLCVAGVLYSIPALFEIRMSPQLSAWIYGFFPHSFAQHMRDGGFRPVVFLEHGLRLAIFFAMAAIAAFSLWRQEKRARASIYAGIWILVVLSLSHSLGGLLIALVFVPIMALSSSKLIINISVFIALIFISYPALRSAGVIPTQYIASLASDINPERGASLQTRIQNEDRLLSRANLKPIAGWGGWGRWRIYDQTTGADISVTDGVWAIYLGTYGWLGYISIFGLLVFPIVSVARRAYAQTCSFATSGLCIVLAANLLDMIPNSSLTPITWLIAGALSGGVRQDAKATQKSIGFRKATAAE